MKNKKTIVINESTHKLVKQYCDNNSLKINNWIDQILIEYMEKNNVRENLPKSKK